jgi:hypothetical protein
VFKDVVQRIDHLVFPDDQLRDLLAGYLRDSEGEYVCKGTRETSDAHVYYHHINRSVRVHSSHHIDIGPDCNTSFQTEVLTEDEYDIYASYHVYTAYHNGDVSICLWFNATLRMVSQKNLN